MTCTTLEQPVNASSSCTKSCARKNFDALSPDVQKKILDANRDTEVRDTDWATYTTDLFREQMLEVGVEVGEVYWSGFWSQGDGASFEGRVRLKEVITNNVFKEQYAVLANALDKFSNCSTVRVHHRGNHCHEGCMQWADHDGLLAEPDEPDECESKLQTQVLKQFFEDAEAQVEGFLEDLLEFLRSKARQLYRDLEAEYEYLTSDECVLENLDSNEQLEEEINKYAERD